jgi:hypothetical protein
MLGSMECMDVTQNRDRWQRTVSQPDKWVLVCEEILCSTELDA